MIFPVEKSRWDEKKKKKTPGKSVVFHNTHTTFWIWNIFRNTPRNNLSLLTFVFKKRWLHSSRSGEGLLSLSHCSSVPCRILLAGHQIVLKMAPTCSENGTKLFWNSFWNSFWNLFWNLFWKGFNVIQGKVLFFDRCIELSVRCPISAEHFGPYPWISGSLYNRKNGFRVLCKLCIYRVDPVNRARLDNILLYDYV